MGTTRYVDWDALKKSVEIGYTFLAKSLWGTGLNREIKALMMAHAMLKAHKIIFRVGEENRRSQRALEKLGILPNELRIMVEVEGNLKRYCVFEVSKNQWAELSKPTFRTEPKLSGDYLIKDFFGSQMVLKKSNFILCAS